MVLWRVLNRGIQGKMSNERNWKVEFIEIGRRKWELIEVGSRNAEVGNKETNERRTSNI
jgi:hypothetical protein